MKKMIIDFIALLVSRRTLWRLGRSLYMKARSDIKNDMNSNGEIMVQRCVLRNVAISNKVVIIFDIGANIGDWTLSIQNQAVKLGVESRINIHSFEPVPGTFSTLQHRIKEHIFFDKSVVLINKALSNKEGTAEIFVVAENAGTNSLYEDPMNATAQRVQIEQSTVDKYCDDHEIKKVDFIKCDTEGNDINVLYGMEELIRSQNVMVIQFEYNHRWVYSRHYLKDVFDFIDGSPYNIGKITRNKIELYKKWHPELEKFFEGNYLIVHENALSWFNGIFGDFDRFDTYNIKYI